VKAEALLRPAVRALKTPRYPDGPDHVLRMDANTNLLGVNPVVRRVLARPGVDWNQYPTPFSSDLRRDLARRHGLSPDQIVVGNGSDELFDLLTRAFVGPGDRIAIAAPTFVMYAFFGKLSQARVVEVPLERPGRQPDVRRLLAARAKILFLSSPNNPTGNLYARDRIEALLDKSRGLVVVDEAYAEFSRTSWLPDLKRRPNLVVTRTFSKAYGLAGLRVGWGAASEEVAGLLHRVKPPFTVNLLSERIARAALAQPAFVERTVAETARRRAELEEGLRARGFQTLPSDANFVTARLGRLVAPLAARGILVRDLSGFAGLEGFARITVGRREHHQAFFAAIERFS
jgi:histidinol-phosphate aminotransferase